LFNYDHLLTALRCLGLHFLFRTSLEIPSALRLCAHPLHGVHHILLLRQDRISHVCHPLNILGHPLHHVWKRRHRLNAWVPGLLGHGVRKCLILQIGVLRHPLL
jgi:hypothetical protein